METDPKTTLYRNLETRCKKMPGAALSAEPCFYGSEFPWGESAEPIAGGTVAGGIGFAQLVCVSLKLVASEIRTASGCGIRRDP